MRGCDAGAVNDTPEIGFEQAPHIGYFDVEDVSVNGDTGIVDPGIKAVETIERGVGDLLDFLFMAHVGDNANGFATGLCDFIAQLVESLFAAGGEHEASALAGGHTGCDKADATRRNR